MKIKPTAFTTIPDPVISQIVTVESWAPYAIKNVAEVLLSRDCPFSYLKSEVRIHKKKWSEVIYSIRIDGEECEKRGLLVLLHLYAGVKVTVTNVRNSDL